MDEGPFVVAVVAIVCLGLPAMILHYITEWRKAKSPTADDERLVEDLWRTAQRLERRVETLERILDKEAPEWRTREDHDEQYGARAPYGGGGNA
ncbi:MAG: envelope stress response membrane protein PspB [Alphaproteobacteria bacterium]|nr:envelope stress response membrane protein PspB [Alphaproteobacteria bacterium]